MFSNFTLQGIPYPTSKIYGLLKKISEESNKLHKCDEEKYNKNLNQELDIMLSLLSHDSCLTRMMKDKFNYEDVGLLNFLPVESKALKNSLEEFSDLVLFAIQHYNLSDKEISLLPGGERELKRRLQARYTSLSMSLISFETNNPSLRNYFKELQNLLEIRLNDSLL